MLCTDDLKRCVGGGFLILLTALFMSWTANLPAGAQDDDEDAYTGADADKIGTEACLVCHADRAAESEKSHQYLIDSDEDNPNYGYSCERCHGPGGNHNGDPKGIINPADKDAEDITGICSACHETLDGWDLEKWADSKHKDVGLSCLTCHSCHSEYDYFLIEDDLLKVCSKCHSDKVDELNAGTHGYVEGIMEMTCTDCHNPHR